MDVLSLSPTRMQLHSGAEHFGNAIFMPVVYRVNVTSVRLRWDSAVTVLSYSVNVSYSIVLPACRV